VVVIYYYTITVRKQTRGVIHYVISPSSHCSASWIRPSLMFQFRINSWNYKPDRQLAELLRQGDRTITRPLPAQDNTEKARECPYWNSNTRFQCSSDRRQYVLRSRGNCDRIIFSFKSQNYTFNYFAFFSSQLHIHLNPLHARINNKFSGLKLQFFLFSCRRWHAWGVIEITQLR
jgi:hypothetical protein